MAPAFDQVMSALKRRYKAPAASSKSDPWQVLLFTLLSARTRDDQTEIVFRRLMAEYPSIPALASAKPDRVADILKNIGLYRSKSKNVIALAGLLMKKHGGRVPRQMTALVDLPGVGRKTASCVLVYAFGIPAIAVDTHVHRVANRLGWVRTKTPEKTEAALAASLPERYWLDVNRVMVQFGREICKPGAPLCWKCPVRERCTYPKKTAL